HSLPGLLGCGDRAGRIAGSCCALTIHYDGQSVAHLLEGLEKSMSRAQEVPKRESTPQLVDTNEAARILGRSPATLKRWRLEGIGPNFVQIHSRIRYDVTVLLDFIKVNTRVPSVRAAMEGLS